MINPDSSYGWRESGEHVILAKSIAVANEIEHAKLAYGELVPIRAGSQSKSRFGCYACGNATFHDARPILWAGLIEEWQLSADEVFYVNRQQGEMCTGCGANLRSSVLAKAILGARGTGGTLADFVASEAVQGLNILEINEAGSLTALLRRIPGYTLAMYPEVDMHALPYPDASFDLVIHSDTLEHVENPLHALTECARVLRPGGAVCYTVPVIVGRLSRSRAGLAKSRHGTPVSGDDYIVHTEFGVDFWTFPAQAGLSKVTIYTVDYPAATAIAASR